MNVLLISYGIKEFDGRLGEIYNITKKLGDVNLVCCGKNPSNNEKEKLIQVNSNNYLSPVKYLTFLIQCLKMAKNMKEIDILFSDNLFASIPALLIRLLYKPKSIVQDVRELYFYKDIKNIAGKIFCKFENILMKKADVVLCANVQRSKIMQEHYKLKKAPLVLENLRFLTGNFVKNELDEKYKKFFRGKINIVNTGGLSVSRTTDKLVYAMTKLPNDFELYLIGEGTDEDKRIIKKIIDDYSLKNVFLLNKVPLPELRYIVQRCDIGIVNYHKRDLNNKYCASGKIYEYLAEGLPVVTTENIPLKLFCDDHRVGVADDNFYNGILKVSYNLMEYKTRVKTYISEISVEKYNNGIAYKIKKVIDNKGKYANE